MKPRLIKKNLKNKKLLCDATMPSMSSLYHKVKRVKRADGKDQDQITVDQFKQVEASLDKDHAVGENLEKEVENDVNIGPEEEVSE